MQEVTELEMYDTTTGGRPHLIFSTELDGSALRHLLLTEGLIDELECHDYGIALGMIDLSDDRTTVVQQLNARGIATIAWLLLPPDEGSCFNVQNYPQAIERYHEFRAWAQHHRLHFDAVGLDIEPPSNEIVHLHHWGMRDIVRRFWLARENVLYPAARAAYTDLVAEIHHDGYEVHSYQLPLLADDRRAGTTLLQRALDVVELPADVEVLICYNSFAAGGMRGNLERALIASYGPSADSLAVGSTGRADGLAPDVRGRSLPPLSWESLEQSLLLAASYTDTIYIHSLEGAVERDMFAQITALDWNQQPTLGSERRALIATMRSLVLALLLITRFRGTLFAWSGWLLALFLLGRGARARRRAQKKDPQRRRI